MHQEPKKSHTLQCMHLNRGGGRSRMKGGGIGARRKEGKSGQDEQQEGDQHGVIFRLLFWRRRRRIVPHLISSSDMTGCASHHCSAGKWKQWFLSQKLPDFGRLLANVGRLCSRGAPLWSANALSRPKLLTYLGSFDENTVVAHHKLWFGITVHVILSQNPR